MTRRSTGLTIPPVRWLLSICARDAFAAGLMYRALTRAWSRGWVERRAGGAGKARSRNHRVWEQSPPTRLLRPPRARVVPNPAAAGLFAAAKAAKEAVTRIANPDGSPLRSQWGVTKTLRTTTPPAPTQAFPRVGRRSPSRPSTAATTSTGPRSSATSRSSGSRRTPLRLGIGCSPGRAARHHRQPLRLRLRLRRARQHPGQDLHGTGPQAGPKRRLASRFHRGRVS